MAFIAVCGPGDPDRLIVRAADAVVAIRGGWGTLPEVALARRLGRPVIGVGPWELDGIERAPDGAAAAARALVPAAG
ncbi:MAG: hypothetical protein IRZ32_14745 [Solirubrobacteraceae bacterium]|mgnify:CR=1 FL=1|nr:hypothetical protein [Solirubrobacteraceae bacterium]